MLDREIPPEAEGNADGGGDVARRIAQETPEVATANKLAVFTALPWITAIVVRSGETKDLADEAAVPAFIRLMLRWNQSRCRSTRTPIRASLRSWVICFSKPRFRRRL